MKKIICLLVAMFSLSATENGFNISQNVKYMSDTQCEVELVIAKEEGDSENVLLQQTILCNQNTSEEFRADDGEGNSIHIQCIFDGNAMNSNVVIEEHHQTVHRWDSTTDLS